MSWLAKHRRVVEIHPSRVQIFYVQLLEAAQNIEVYREAFLVFPSYCGCSGDVSRSIFFTFGGP